MTRCKEYDELMFNIYENINSYSMEAVFDEDKIIFGREDYAPILGLENVEYLTVASCK